MPSTDVTIEHYQRPEVKEVILRYCQGEQGARALNSDEHWYKGTDDINHTVMLRGPADYEDTIKRGRTLYATLDILEQAVFEHDSKWDEKAGRPEAPLGTLAECPAFTLSTDIDGIGDIRNLAVKEAVEAAGQFHINYLRERGIEKSVYCLYSGGGIYVHLHHGLFAVDVGNTELTPEARKEQYQILCKAYNRVIGEISQAFFREHPEHIGRVKFDQLNNQKRTFKTIFSIHKRLPFAVIPLDPTAIKISFEKASLPLSDEVLQEGANWYQSFDPSERAALGPLLQDKIEAVRAAARDRPAGSTDGEISRLEEPLDLADFAPCMKNIIEKAEDHEGRHRALAVLSTYLYQAGWPEDRAFDLWLEVADRCGVESRIFETTFGLVSCPLCSTMLQDTGGYPHLNLFNMGFCVPDEHCKGCQWPGDHHNQKILNEMGQERAKSEEQEPGLKTEDVCDIEIDDDGDIQKITLAPTRASEAIIAHFTLAMEKGDDQIYYYNPDGIYDPDGARKIDLVLTSVAGDANNNFKLREVLRRVRNQLLEGPVTFDPDPYVLGVSNGLVDLRTGEFRQYKPEDMITDRIDVAYDPEAKCPMFMEFLDSISPDPIDRLMLVDWFAITAIKEPFAYVLFLLGLGRNGKGIYEKILQRFFGHGAFRDMPLMAIEKSDFAASEFYKKRGWIASETGRGKSSIGTDFIKLTSGNGVIDANVKGKSRIKYEPFFQTLVDTNTMPQINDNSIGWKERFCKANLPYVFVAEPDPNNPLERKRDPHLIDKLTTAGELSGILNLVIYRAKEIAKTKTITKRSGEAMFDEYAEQSASVGTFLERFCEYVTTGADFWMPVTPVYDAYREWCDYKVGEVVDPRYFGKLLTDFCGGATVRIGKDKDRKSIREYKRLNFNKDRYEAEAKRLRLGVSTYVYNSLQQCLHDNPSTDSDVYVVYMKTWIEIYKKYGDPSINPLYRGNWENHVDDVDNVDIDSSGGPKVSTTSSPDVDPNVDKHQFCAKCGEDLTGHGTHTIGDVVYCLKPGCGMPEREEASP